jgi:branched-subunit amino acid ABC-type transport system permease component
VAAYVSAAYRDAIVYAVLIAALLFRPEGLLGRR